MALITVKSLEAIIQQLRDAARIRFPELDTGFTSIENELLFVIHAYAGRVFMQELANIVAQIDLTTLTGERLEEEAKKYGLERSAGKKATGYATFFTTITPPLTGWVIPKGTIVSTRMGITSLNYITQETITIYATDFKTDTNRYEKTASIIAENPGTIYNIGPGLIGIIQTPIENIQGVTNYDFISGGTDEESDDELREALLKRIVGRNIGSVEGIEVRIERQFDLVDAKMILPRELDSERLTGTDLFVIYEAEEQVVGEPFVYITGPKEFILSRQPVVRVSEVRVNGVPLNATDWVLVKDNSPTRESIYAKDLVNIIANLNTNDNISIDYVYSRIDSIQSFIDARENKIPSANIWVKRGRRYNVNIQMSVGFKQDVVIADEQLRIINALTIYLDTFDLGEELDESDLISTIQRGFSNILITSVDFVVIQNFYAVDDYGNVITPVNNRISMDNKSYVRLGTVTFL